MAVNFTKHQDEITNAWRKVVEAKDTQNWALFGYEGSTNIIKLDATGSGGLDELVRELNCSLIQYAFCRVIDRELNLNKLVLINWQGDSAPLSRKGLCASHVGDVTNYFKGCTQTITIRNDDEATREHLMEQIVKTSASKIDLSRHQNSFNQNSNNDSANNSISLHIKVDISSDLTANRKSFWQQQEEEEKERLAEEKRRAAEKQAQFEKERKQRQEFEAKKLAETIKERERLIEANKKAERPVGGKQQPSSQVTSTTADHAGDDDDADDGRVGRRSELIRLERNQETQSLISKGLIKNKRAIFEQAQQQHQQSQQQTLTRRSSGAIVTQRMNAFKSLDNSSSAVSSSVNVSTTGNSVVNKLANSFAEQANVDGDRASGLSNPVAIRKEVEPVVLTKDSEHHIGSPAQDVSHASESNEVGENEHVNKITAPASPSPSSKPQQLSHENGQDKAADVSQDVNGNSENSFSDKSLSNEAAANTTSEVITNEELIMNGKKSNITAVAMFDYQAADNTEISFDPDDNIGHIQKVDPGWWHGQVMSGRFKGQIGLFPANYVQELESP